MHGPKFDIFFKDLPKILKKENKSFFSYSVEQFNVVFLRWIGW